MKRNPLPAGRPMSTNLPKRLRGRALERQQALLTLKERHTLTYAQLAELTGFAEGSLKMWGAGLKPISRRSLRLVEFHLAAHQPPHPAASEA